MALVIERATWNELRVTVDKLLEDNVYLTPYSEYSFLDRIKASANIHRVRESRKYTLECYVVRDDGNAVCVAPLLVNKVEKKLYLLGEFSSVGHLDFIYSAQLTTQQLSGVLDLVFSNYPGYVFLCDRISQFSLTKQVFDEKLIEPQSQDVCVKIDLTNYDEWYKALKKSCRQNIRTSYNRLNTDGADITFQLFINEKPPKKFWRENIALFSKRILEHTKLPKLLLYPMILFKRNETLGRALYEAQNSIFASVYINNKLAATLNGVIANDGRAIITRLSIETNMGKYSPGGLLLNETIKEVCSEYSFIKSIDLSRGDEPYKYTYGGCEHYNYGYNLKIGEDV